MISTSEGSVDLAGRGGSWWDVARGARAAYRSACDPSYRDGYLGLRLARRCP